MRRTIRDVLQESIAARPQDTGSEASVFAFPEDLPDLAPYRLRLMQDFDPHWLERSTCLMPVREPIGGIRVGQPLLWLESDPSFTIMPLQHGLSWKAWEAKQSQAFADMGIHGTENRHRTQMALCNLLLDFEKQSINPFVRIFEDSYRLGALGYDGVDHAKGNIIFDVSAHTMSLIDQLDRIDGVASRETGLTNVSKLASRLLNSFTNDRPDAMLPEPPLRAEWQRRNDAVSAMIREAKDIVITTHSTTLERPVAFAKVDSVQAVRLDSPPSALVENLRRIEQQACIPAR